MRDRVVPRIRDVPAALAFLLGRAEASPGEWARVDSGDDGRLRLGWRCADDGTHRLVATRPDGAPSAAERYGLRRALTLAHPSLAIAGEEWQRAGTVLELSLLAPQGALL